MQFSVLLFWIAEERDICTWYHITWENGFEEVLHHVEAETTEMIMDHILTVDFFPIFV